MANPEDRLGRQPQVWQTGARPDDLVLLQFTREEITAMATDLWLEITDESWNGMQWDPVRDQCGFWVTPQRAVWFRLRYQPSWD